MGQNTLLTSLAAGDALNRCSTIDWAGADADVNDLHKIQYYSPGGLHCTAAELTLALQTMVRDLHKSLRV